MQEAINRSRTVKGDKAELRNIFPNLIPSRPYCGDFLRDGLSIRQRSVALTKRHLQLNGPASFQWMSHDIDRADAYFAHRDANLPPPNVIMVNPENGHGHAAYLLKTPVARHAASRLQPLRYYAAVERGVSRRMEADRHFAGLIVKNPLHTDWKVEWRREEPYSLDELADSLFERDMRPDPTPAETFGAGRNVTVFDELRTVAYREVRQYKRDGQNFEAWLDRCLKIALSLNLQFPDAMKIGEVRAIAKSVAKWTWQRFSAEKFSAIQSARGKASAAKRWAGRESLDKTMPWIAMGISRRTYFNRKAAGAL